MDLLSELINEASDERITIDVHYAGALGGQGEITEQELKGNIEMLMDGNWSSVDPRIGIIYTPYLVLSWEDAKESLQVGGWLPEVVDPIFASIGIKFLGTWGEGFGGVATRGAYATNPEDASAIKVRTQPVFPFPQTIRALGYQATALPWEEVYTAIQTGIVDGDSGNIIYWDYETFRDVLDYYVWYRQVFSNAPATMNLELFNSLDSEDQQIVVNAADQMLAKQAIEGEKVDLHYRQLAIDYGIEFIELTPAEFDVAVGDVREKVWSEMEESIGTYLVEQIRARATKVD